MKLVLVVGLSTVFVVGLVFFAAAGPQVRLLATGGTIASASTGGNSYAAGQLSADELIIIAAAPELQALASMTTEQVVKIGSVDSVTGPVAASAPSFRRAPSQIATGVWSATQGARRPIRNAS